jgi:preprotein translocase subunit SecE
LSDTEWPEWLAEEPLPDESEAEAEGGDDVEKEDAEEVDELVVAEPRPPADWPTRAVWIAATLVVVVAVVLLGALIVGLATSGRTGSFFARFGESYTSGVGLEEGLALLGAAGLATWGRSTRVLRSTIVVTVILFVLTPVAMSGAVSYARHAHEVTGELRWQLATYFVETAVPAALAGVVAWWGLP